MRLSEKGAAFVRLHEGFVARYYLDPVGIATIGIGFTWRSDSFRQWWAANKKGATFGPGATMTREEAERALIYLCEREYGKAVNRFLGKRVPQHVFDGMVSPVYNLGGKALEWKWAAAAKAGDYPSSASLLRKTGTTAAGRKLAGLVRRRQEEALLIEKGIYTGVGTVAKPGATVDAMADGILVRREEGPAVAKLIRDLAALGYYDGRLDDVFGPGTESAVMQFQRDKGLKIDGLVGPKTFAAIEAALKAKTPSPAPTPTPRPEPAPALAQGFWAALANLIRNLFSKG